MDNELVNKIRNHPKYNESVHSAPIEVIEREYSPEQLSVMLAAPVLDSLVGGMLASMLTFSQGDDDNETAVHKASLDKLLFLHAPPASLPRHLRRKHLAGGNL